MAEKDNAAAPEANDGAKSDPSADSGEAGSGLEGILDEFDKEFSDRKEPETGKRDEPAKEPESKGPTTDSRIDEVVAWVQQQKQEESRNQVEASLDEGAKLMTDAHPELADVSEDALKGLLIRKVSSDARLARLYVNRDTAPDSWKRAVEQIASDEVAARNRKTDRKATDDREAARQSVKGSRAKQADESGAEFEQRINEMSPAEFAKFRKRNATTGLVR